MTPSPMSRRSVALGAAGLAAVGLGGAGLAAAGGAVGAPAALTALFATSNAGPGGGEREPVAQLVPVAGSGVGGTVRVRPTSGDRVSVALAVTGLRPGLAYVVRLHSGPPDRLSASSGRLGDLLAGPDGRATVTVTEARLGGSGAAVPLTLDLFADGDHTIVVVAPEGVDVAHAVLARTP